MSRSGRSGSGGRPSGTFGVRVARHPQPHGRKAARRGVIRKCGSGWRALAVGLSIALFAASAAAQTFHGTYTTMGSAGPIDLTLERSGLALSGSIEGNGNNFALSGEVLADDQTISFGTVEAPGGTLIFEAYLVESGLELYLFTPLANGEVELESVTVFEPEAPPSAAPAANSTPGNPLAGAKAANSFAGRYSDGSLTLELLESADGYEGSITVADSSYPVNARLAGDGIKGTFSAGGTSYPFSFKPDGQAYVLESDGASYQLSAMNNPLATAVGSTATPEQESSADESLATGPYGTFTRDAALAYIEALEFSLQLVGQSGVLAGTTQQQLIDTLATNYSALDPDSQMAMANARQIWTETQAGWPIASPLEQQEFVLAVLTIAYGEQAARSALGLGGTGGGNGGGGGYVGMPSADPQVQEDTFNSQGCWAAAGCSDYDPVGNDFTFDTPGDY